MSERKTVNHIFSATADELWIVGQEGKFFASDPVPFPWHFLGVFDSEEVAMGRCKMEGSFYFRVSLNKGGMGLFSASQMKRNPITIEVRHDESKD